MAEDANLQKLKAYLWKRKSETFVDGQSKGSIIADMSFDATGKIQVKVVDAENFGAEKTGSTWRSAKKCHGCKNGLPRKGAGTFPSQFRC